MEGYLVGARRAAGAAQATLTVSRMSGRRGIPVLVPVGPRIATPQAVHNRRAFSSVPGCAAPATRFPPRCAARANSLLAGSVSSAKAVGLAGRSHGIGQFGRLDDGSVIEPLPRHVVNAD